MTVAAHRSNYRNRGVISGEIVASLEAIKGWEWYSDRIRTKVVTNECTNQELIEATSGIEIHENRRPQSRLGSISHFITRVQRSTSRLSPSFLMSVHGVVPNPYQMTAFYITAKVNASIKRGSDMKMNLIRY